MNALSEDSAKQWEVLLRIIASEEKKKIDRRNVGALDTLKYFWNHRGVRHIFTEWLQQMKLRYDKQTAEDESSQKSDSISLLWRQRGNAKFKEGNFEESFVLYTKSVIYANKQTALYSIALANRSAASFRLKRYEDCIKDIHLALNHNYPQDLQHKLYLRRAECYLDSGQKRKAIDAMLAAIKHNDREPLTGKSKIDYNNAYNALEVKLAGLKSEKPQRELNLPQLFMGENPNFKNASAAIELRQSDTVGRYVVTKEATKRGDVLFSEEPFASVKLNEKELPHPSFCDYCCSNEAAVIACSKCTNTLYCNDECFNLGYSTYHRWECAAARANIISGIGKAHLALRVMLKYTFNGFPRLPESAAMPTTAFELTSRFTQINKVNVYKQDTADFYRMFNLMSNADTSANTDNIQYALTAVMLTMYLEEFTSFFGYFPDQVGYKLPEKEMKLLCATLIFRTLGQLVINAHDILDLNTTPAPNMPLSDQPEYWCKIGWAIYPSISMMNHSCEPNVTNLFYKNHLYVKGIHELPKDAEVLNCYGPHYARHSTDDRRDKLRRQYGFTCMCPACTDDTRKDFANLFSAYACPSCRGPVTWRDSRVTCPQCSHKFPLQTMQNAAETAAAMQALVKCKRCHSEFNMGVILTPFDRAHALMHSAMRATTPKEHCELMARSYSFMQQVQYRHHNNLRKISDNLAKLYSGIGEFGKSMDLIKQNIQSFEYQYGSFSIEVTNEIRKMAHMMIARLIELFDNPELDDQQMPHLRDFLRETLKIVRKANQLMELNFGTWPPMYKGLKDKEALLESMMYVPEMHSRLDCPHQRMQGYNLG